MLKTLHQRNNVRVVESQSISRQQFNSIPDENLLDWLKLKSFAETNQYKSKI